MFRIALKVFLVLASMLLVALLVLVLPTRKLCHLRGELREKTERMLADTDLVGGFMDPDAELKMVQKQWKGLEERFPTAQGIPFVLQQLGDKSREQGLDILSLNPMEEEKVLLAPGAAASKYDKKKILMELQCEYQALGRYLASLATLPTFFSIEELSMSSKAPSDAMLHVRLVLAFYVMRPGA